MALIILLFLSLQAFGGEASVELTKPLAQCACAARAVSQFEDPIQFNFGVFKGQCVDSCRFRKTVILSKQAARAFHFSEGGLVFTNVLHGGKFWTAVAPGGRVTEIDVAFERFLPMISHVFLLFRFEQPVFLYQEEGSPKREKVYELVLSVEGIPPKGHAYRFFESSRSTYLLGYRFLSVAEAYATMIKRLGHSIKQYRLNLDDKARDRLFVSAVTTASKNSFQSIYQLFTNNCATSAMDLVSGAADPQTQAYNWFGIDQLQRGIPLEATLGTFRYLTSRGLISAENDLPNLEVEFRAFKKSPSTN
ncbi:MAG: lipoprotein N-acyltransferase Lnb domain-containing protein [Bdellovibrionales bacterium]